MKSSLRSYRKRAFIYKIRKLIFILLGLFAHKSWCLPLALILCQVLSPCLVCLVWILCLFSSRIPGRGVPHMIHGSTLLVLGSRLHWQAVPCGAGLCRNMVKGCSGTRHKQCPEHVPVAELFVIMVFLSMMCFLPVACTFLLLFTSVQVTWKPSLHTMFSTSRISRSLYGIFLAEGSLNFQENVQLVSYYFGVHFLFALWLNYPL